MSVQNPFTSTQQLPIHRHTHTERERQTNQYYYLPNKGVFDFVVVVDTWYNWLFVRLLRNSRCCVTPTATWNASAVVIPTMERYSIRMIIIIIESDILRYIAAGGQCWGMWDLMIGQRYNEWWIVVAICKMQTVRIIRSFASKVISVPVWQN